MAAALQGLQLSFNTVKNRLAVNTQASQRLHAIGDPLPDFFRAEG